jgi:hypothetical protein
MTLRLLAATVALTVILSALPWEITLAPAAVMSTSAVLEDFPPVPHPDPLEPGDPCSDDCPCLCCPGGPAFTLAHAWITLTCPADVRPLSELARHHPSFDASRLIFRPPRLS